MFKLFVGIMSRVPLRLAWWFSWSVAWLWWLVIPIRRAVAIDGFSRAFPDLPVGPNLRRSAAELIMGYVELFREVRRPCIGLTVEGAEMIHNHLKTGQGMILVAGHFGSWDLLGPLVCRDEALPATVVVKTPKWKPAAEFIDGIRRDFGMGLLPPRNSYRDIIKELKKGRIIVLLLDQRYVKGIPVPFFGRPAWTTPVVPLIVERTGVPVFGLDYWREGVGKHHARFAGPLQMVGDMETDTTAIQKFCEERIRERPHAWLWMHDRWSEPRT